MTKVNELVDEKQFPSISIVISTQAQYPKFKDDVERLKHLTNEVREQLRKQYSKAKMDMMMEKLHKVINGIDFTKLTHGLAIFVSPQVEKVIHLPFDVSSEKIIVDESFEMRDVIYAAKKSRRFLLVIISKNAVKTFFGVDSSLSEVEFPDMPANVADVTNEHSKPGLPYFDIEAHDEINIRNFVRLIDEEIEKELRNKDYPVILMGDTKQLGFLKQHTRNVKRIAGAIEGNYEHATITEIKKRIRPVLEQMYTADQDKALQLLAGSVNTDKYSAGITEVWRAAAEGKGRLLLVEKDYKQSARYGDDRFSIVIDDEMNNMYDRVADAVDDVIEMVLKNKGDVVFVENGSLKEYEHIALLTRY